MMRNRFYYSLFAAASLLLASCEKVIDIKLNDAEKKYVIEGVLTDEAGSAAVVITQTKNFADDNQFAGITGATVTITDSDGNSTALSETSAGVYQSSGLTGVTGKTYSLTVEIGTNIFTASSAMPSKVNMDTLYVSEDLMFGEVRKLANIDFLDPEGLGQSYRFVQYVNGVKRTGTFIRNDDYTDGNKTSVRLFSDEDIDDDKKIKTGDIIKVDMLCIDKDVYKYWNSFGTGGATGSSNTSSPANPVTNITGGALGYFSAHTVQSKTVVVQ